VQCIIHDNELVGLISNKYGFDGRYDIRPSLQFQLPRLHTHALGPLDLKVRPFDFSSANISVL